MTASRIRQRAERLPFEAQRALRKLIQQEPSLADVERALRIPQSSAIAGAAGAPIRHRSRARILDALERLGLLTSNGAVVCRGRLQLIADEDSDQ